MSTDVRQQALLQTVALIQSDTPLGTVDTQLEPDLRALAFAMERLGDPRSNLLPVEGPFPELLEANNITYREIRTPTDFRRQTRPLLIVFREADQTPLVLFQRGDGPTLFEPEGNSIRPLTPEDALKPFAFELYASLPTPLRSAWQLLRFSLSANIPALLTVVFSALVVSLFNLSIPTLTSFLVGTVLPQGDLRLIVETSGVVILIALATVVSQGFSTLATVRMESLLNLRLESAVWSHLLRLPLPFFQTLNTADLNTRIAAISQIRMLLSSGLLQTGLGFIFSLSSLGLMFIYQAQIALVAGAFTLVATIAMLVLVSANLRLQRPYQEGQALMGDIGLQSVIGLPQIRVSGSEPFLYRQWMGQVSRVSWIQRQGEVSSGSLEILARMLSPMGSLVIFITLVMLQNQTNPQDPGAIGSQAQLVASFVAFQAAYMAFTSQLSAVAVQLANTYGSLKVLWERASVVFYATPESGYDPSARQLILKGEYRVDELVVRYPHATDPVINGLSLHIPAGGYTAITGPSGCGKSTLLRCLLGLMEPESGLISVDGVDLREVAIRNYRRQLGVVLQNAPLPTGSIYDVVRAGRSLSREEVWEALALAQVADDIRRMPMQLETIISEGAMSISGGQRQRVSLARALVGKPSVLLLDEATSALDAPTQAAITATIAQLPITRIAIAHRHSTIEPADQILVLRHGQIQEQGTYRELSSRVGGYLYRE